jgi:hypothetical protein
MESSVELVQHNDRTKFIKNGTLQLIFSLVFLVAGFLGVVGWFQVSDFYHTQFFNHGFSLVIYNLLKTIFALYVIWIVYAIGYGMTSMLIPATSRKGFTLLERIILGFGSGLGFWHLFMLMLGHFNLYYPAVMVGISLVVLCASSVHFNHFLLEIQQLRKLPSTPRSNWYKLSVFAVMFSLIWLLVVRGLFPGGGGDYYTHYFPYYLAVLKNHGLAPNDVWYHYYYSKGAGLQIYGMLLTDPEAPALMTFCCVSIAVFAIMNLLGRISPRTFWPGFCAVLYILSSLFIIDQSDGGEFQKLHEETTAIFILGLWAACMVEFKPKEWERASFIMLALLTIGAAILTQAAAVFFAMFFAAQTVVAVITKNSRKAVFYIGLGIIASVAVLGVLLMNYLVTGLATDQAFNLTWKFANVDRLNQWGVLPNIMMVAWIRDNYDMVATSWEFKATIIELASFMRLDSLSLIFFCVFFGLSCYFEEWLQRRNNPLAVSEGSQVIRKLLFTVGLMTAVFTVLALVVGHSQSTSFHRFSTFFFPLLALFATTIFIFLSNRWKFAKGVFPVLLLLAVLASWHDWGGTAKHDTKQAMRLLKGKYSLADAYAHQPSGLPFGGIHPGAYTAVQQVPMGSRVWSTNVDSYCMAPNCVIESVISFKLSANLSDILSGTPADAKKILQQEKLNYFLVSKDSMLLDLLPFSHLFDPTNISQYLGIKWTDGNTYLLTWREDSTQPLDAKFIAMYKKLIKKSIHPWFRFNEAVPAMKQTMAILESSPHPWKPIVFPWRIEKPSKPYIKIHHASYGRNCMVDRQNGHINRISASNATSIVKTYCHKKTSCSFVINKAEFGDPAENCPKSLMLSYRCMPKPQMHKIYISGEALGKTVGLSCKVQKV